MIPKVRENVFLHKQLEIVLTDIEKLGYDVTITDSAREITDHMAVYQKLYPANWREKIPWGSLHLPSYAYPGVCMAVDFGVTEKKTRRALTGLEIKALIDKFCTDYGYTRGLGIGKMFCHFDVRKINAEWSYNY